MKILYVINSLVSGGAEKLLESFVPKINKIDGIKADILLLTDEKNVFYESLVNNGVNIRVIKYNNMNDPRNIIEISKILKNSDYDIVHSHLFPAQYWVALAKLLINKKNVKYTTTEHSTDNRRRTKPIFKPIEKFVYSKYDSVISITEEVEEKLINWIGEDKDNNKYIVIENGINIKKIENTLPYNKEMIIEGSTDNTKIICMVGKFNKAKDQGTLIRSMKNLPDTIELVLVGEGPLGKENKELTKSLNIENRVHFLGFRTDVYKILKTSDIVVLSSHYEGLSLAALEALAVGKPLVGSRVAGIEGLLDGYGLLFEQGDEFELANIIMNLLNNEDLYQETVKKGRLRVNHYSIETMIENLVEEYKRLLK